ncbi:MAG: glycosyltransferase family 2 protein [candidate division KSB1 bacterium]|nr:glycosyltransferase family 2 protein [candidate division KSB1 bacterium]MDZ7345341.1 glycosyltransferase family 2 protein [candidate division KSB1 bacterium]
MNSHEPLELSIVIPMLNEEESIEELGRLVLATVSQLNVPAEIIFVDDGSTDGSAERVRRLCRLDPRFKMIRFRRNCGKAAALAAGFQAAQGNFVVTMDADLQDDPAEIPKLLKKLDEGWDLVSGWKVMRQDPFTKRLLSKIYNRFTSWFSGIRLHDFNCGLKAYRRDVVKSFKLYGELHRYLPVIAYRNGFRVTEVPVQHHARKYGRSKYGAARLLRGAFDLLTVTFLTRYKSRPLHLFGTWGMLSSLAGFIILTVLAMQKIFFGAHLSKRPLLFLGLLLMIVGIQFFSIGLLGEMITESRADAPDNSLIKERIGWENES